MYKPYLILPLLFIFISSCEPPEEDSNTVTKTPFVYKPIKVRYPAVFRDTNQVDTFYNTPVIDPYRWLEYETEPAQARWIKAQNRVTDAYFTKIPYREALRKRQKDIWNFARYGIPQYKGDRYYISYNDGLQNQDVLRVTDRLAEDGEVFMDPNRLSDEGTVSLNDYSFSADGSLMAMQVSEAGSDWQTIKVLETQRGRPLSDELQWVKFSRLAWWNDGFFYSRYPAPASDRSLTAVNEFHQLYYHRLGDPQHKDELIFADRRHPRRNVYAQTTEDERFLFMQLSESTSGNAAYFMDLQEANPGLSPIVEGFDSDYSLIDSDGDRLLLLTNDNAPNSRVIRVSSRRPERNFWEEIIPNSQKVISSVKKIGDRLLVHYIEDVASKLSVYNLEGEELGEVSLPSIGTVTDIEKGKGGEVFFGFTTFTWPEVIYRLNIEDLSLSIWKKPEINFASDNYEIKQVFFESIDNERIPMFIIHKKGLKMDGKRPTLLYGYGGFDVPVLPRWNVTKSLLFPTILENNGVCAVANIRGGGEYGRRWHESGSLLKKQNSFEDFQFAAQYLLDAGITNSNKLGIYGRSNGGLLVGACMTQRPDLYKVAVSAVGVLDMLRYHKFTIGWAWANDYGTVDDPDQFDVLKSYSPLHNVIPDRYPATLITTGDHDDRVAPAHSYKFTAELQHQQKGDEPILIRIDQSAGHGAGKPTDKLVEEAADIISFFFYNLQEDVIYR